MTHVILDDKPHLHIVHLILSVRTSKINLGGTGAEITKNVKTVTTKL